MAIMRQIQTMSLNTFQAGLNDELAEEIVRLGALVAEGIEAAAATVDTGEKGSKKGRVCKCQVMFSVWFVEDDFLARHGVRRSSFIDCNMDRFDK